MQFRCVTAYTAAFDLATWSTDHKTCDATVRNFEVLGEACRHLPERFTQAHPQIPWRNIAGLRNRIAHEYFDLDYPLIWVIIQNELPQLKQQLIQLRGALTED